LNLVDAIPPDEVVNLVSALRTNHESALEEIHPMFSRLDALIRSPRVERLAMPANHLGDSSLLRRISVLKPLSDPLHRTIALHEMTGWHGEVAELLPRSSHDLEPATRSVLLLVVGGITSTSAERITLGPRLEELCRTATDATTRQAARWAVRPWGLTEPAAMVTPGLVQAHVWYDVSDDLTMISLEPGPYIHELFLEPGWKQFSIGQRMALPLDVGDREISIGLFQQFLDDPDYPPEEKPADWPGPGVFAETSPRHPIQNVTWYEAILFCNWLSRRFDLPVCYRRTGEREPWSGKTYDRWEPIEGATGFRLPNEKPWMFACLASSSGSYHFGKHGSYRAFYAACDQSLQHGERAGGSLRPSIWGLHDMHGNVYEWCENLRLASFRNRPEYRATRGGGYGHSTEFCVAWRPGGDPPHTRVDYNGFRVFRSRPDRLTTARGE
jgi:hypothetical protein